MKIDFDKYSLILNYKRTLIKSAALHYFRTPGEDLWLDRLSKIKAAGYNTVDLYFSWGYHSHKQGVYDFTDIKDIRKLLDITTDLGLFIIARPGPFINAETSGGGFPFWLLGKENVIPRNRRNGDFVYSEEYMKAVKEWYSRIIPIINEYDNVIAFQIENEYSTNEAEPDYIQELHDLAREFGVKAPIFHNDAFCACLYSDIVNIYATDIYPYINLEHDWKDNIFSFDMLDNLEENIRPCKENAPLFIAEMQSGWFDKWGGVGYDRARSLFGKEHINIVTKTALSQGVTMFNHFLGIGGTSWGNLACDEVYTSYDFAAPISEEGIPKGNYYKAKEINYFLDGFDLSSTDFITSDPDILSQRPDNIYTILRQDNINNCKWLFIRNFNTEVSNIETQKGYKISLKPFDMRILPIDLSLFGCRIDFSSFQIFTRITRENHEVLFLIADTDSELIISDFESTSVMNGLTHIEGEDKLHIKLKQLPESGMLFSRFSKANKTTEIVFLSQELADKTWIIDNKVIIGPDFIYDNPHKAAFSSKTEVKVLNPEKDNQWKAINIDGPEDVPLVKLEKGNVFNCSPEIDEDFDYSSWNIAENNTSCLPNKLFDEFIWYKTEFTGSFEYLEINAKHCYAIYLNGKQVFEYDTIYGETEENVVVHIKGELFKHHNNQLTVLVQNLGFDKGFSNDPNLPRGLIEFKTYPEKDFEWHVRDKVTPEIEEWDFQSVDNLEHASKNHYLEYFTTEFKIEKKPDTYAPMYVSLTDTEIQKASIYLNGKKIGRFWPEKSPQKKFYLIESFLKENNRLSLVIWNKKDNKQHLKDYKFDSNNVNINISNFNVYRTFDLESLF